MALQSDSNLENLATLYIVIVKVGNLWVVREPSWPHLKEEYAKEEAKKLNQIFPGLDYDYVPYSLAEASLWNRFEEEDNKGNIISQEPIESAPLDKTPEILKAKKKKHVRLTKAFLRR